jgi:hypothetical protein
VIGVADLNKLVRPALVPGVSRRKARAVIPRPFPHAVIVRHVRVAANAFQALAGGKPGADLGGQFLGIRTRPSALCLHGALTAEIAIGCRPSSALLLATGQHDFTPAQAPARIAEFGITASWKS